MNKTELINQIVENAGLSKTDAKKALDATIEAISDSLRAGDKVQLLGLGTFSTSMRPARQGRNPQTGEVVQIAEKKVVRFKAGNGLI